MAPSSGQSSRGKRLLRSISSACGAMRLHCELADGLAQLVHARAELEVEIDREHARPPPGLRLARDMILSDNQTGKCEPEICELHFEPLDFAPAYLRVSEAIRAGSCAASCRRGGHADRDRARPPVRGESLDRARGPAQARERRAPGAATGRQAPGRDAPDARVGRRRGLSQALALHRARVVDVWEALQARAAGHCGRGRRAALAGVARESSRTRRDALRRVEGGREVAVADVAGFFDALGEAAANPVFNLLNEPLLRLLKPSLAVIIDRSAAGAIAHRGARSRRSSRP